MKKKKKAKKKKSKVKKKITKKKVKKQKKKTEPVVKETQKYNYPMHEVECTVCGGVTRIKKVGMSPLTRFHCIRCNAALDVFNNCRTCNLDKGGSIYG